MTSPAQQLRNIKGGMLCVAKYGSAHMAAIGRKGGLKPKKYVYQPPAQNNDRSMPASYKELLKAVFDKENLRIGGLRVSRNAVYPVTGS